MVDRHRDAEPSFERRARLMQQHAKTVDAREAATTRLTEQRRFKRGIDDVGDDGVLRQAGESEV